MQTGPSARGKCTPSAYGTSPQESVSLDSQVATTPLRIQFACHPGGGGFSGSSPCANLSCSSYSGKKSAPSGVAKELDL